MFDILWLLLINFRVDNLQMFDSALITLHMLLTLASPSIARQHVRSPHVLKMPLANQYFSALTVVQTWQRHDPLACSYPKIDDQKLEQRHRVIIEGLRNFKAAILGEIHTSWSRSVKTFVGRNEEGAIFGTPASTLLTWIPQISHHGAVSRYLLFWNSAILSYYSTLVLIRSILIGHIPVPEYRHLVMVFIIFGIILTCTEQ